MASENELTDFEKALQKKFEGIKIFICSGPECTKAGTQKALRIWAQKRFAEHEIGKLNCIGRCQINHAFRFNNKNFSAKTETAFNQIIDSPV